MRPGIFVVLALSVAGAAAGSEPAATGVPPASGRPWPIQTRSAAQVATDLERKPAETLRFAGIQPSMVVGAFFPGGATSRTC